MLVSRQFPRLGLYRREETSLPTARASDHKDGNGGERFLPNTYACPSALGKNRPFALTKSDPHEEHDLPVGKKNGERDIIHAEGERFAIPSSAPQARNLLSLRHALVKPISQPRVAA